MLRSARHVLVNRGCYRLKGPTLSAFGHGPQVVSRVAEGDERSERALVAAEDRGTIRNGVGPARRPHRSGCHRGAHHDMLGVARFSASRPIAQMNPTSSRATAVATFAAGLRW